MIKFESTIRGGLPVIVHANISPPEPDVGYPNPTAELEIYFPHGGEYKGELSEDDRQRLTDEAFEWDQAEIEAYYDARG